MTKADQRKFLESELAKFGEHKVNKCGTAKAKDMIDSWRKHTASDRVQRGWITKHIERGNRGPCKIKKRTERGTDQV
jgi:hypothetical protein